MSIATFKIQIGATVTDRISGFRGVVTAYLALAARAMDLRTRT